MKFSKLAVAITGALALTAMTPALAASAATSSPRPSFASQATSFQNSTISAALRRAPGGKRTGSGQVEWRQHGHLAVVMTVPATAKGSTLAPNVADSCPAPIIGTRWSCVYDEISFGGTRLQFTDAGPYQDLHNYGGNEWDTNSWSNTRGQRAWLNEFASHSDSGLSLCMTGNAHAGNVASNPAGTDRWIYLSTNTAAC
jgi:hypothetical protein